MNRMADAVLQALPIAGFLAGLLAFVWAGAFFTRRGPWGSAGRCTGCRYDLAGLPVSAPCPECGLPAGERGDRPLRRSIHAASLLGLIPPALGVAACEWMLASVSGFGSLGLTSVLFHAAPFAVLAAVLAQMALHRGWTTILLASFCGSLSGSAGIGLMYMALFVWTTPDPFAGLLIFAAPLVGIAAMGYGMPVAALIVRQTPGVWTPRSSRS